MADVATIITTLGAALGGYGIGVWHTRRRYRDELAILDDSLDRAQAKQRAMRDELDALGEKIEVIKRETGR